VSDTGKSQKGVSKMTDQQPYTQRMKDIGGMLREARESAGKSIRETARLSGISSSTLTAYEEGRKPISLPELELFSYHVNVPVRRFLGRSEAVFYPKRVDFDPKIMLTLRNRTIGAMIRAKRLEEGLSIRQLAKQTGWPTSRINAYERGERPVPLPVLETLAALFSQSLEDFMPSGGPIAQWDGFYESLDTVMEIPEEMRTFLKDKENARYIELAMRLSKLPLETLKIVAEGLLDLTI
jgi:transcriptional regulator with XRE-family HTH domain